MERFGRWTPDIPLPAVPRAVALGVFDGVHIGHRAVISALCGIRFPENGPFLRACVLSLTNVPKTGVRLTDEQEERQLCGTLGVDEWLALPFERVRDLSPAAFVEDILHRTLHAKVVCCGYNYRFGNQGCGDAALLEALCEPLGIRVMVIPAVSVEGQAVSATRIRAALEQGDPAAAGRLLGRPFTVRQPVAHGNRLGHTLGFPTINQPFTEGCVVPRFGVYASLVVIDGRQHFAVTNVGIHPTVGGISHPQAETWIEGFDGELYGRSVAVQLIRFLREERRFDSLDELKQQIRQDRQQALEALSGNASGPLGAVLFDFDDTLQDRPVAFMATARELLRRHQPELTDEQRDQRAQIMLAENAGGYVNYRDYFRSLLERWDWHGVSADELLAEFQRCFPNHTTLFPGTRQTLTELRRRGYRLGIVTNGNPLVQNRKLDCCGLRSLVDQVVVSGDEGVHKPDPELFRRAAARFGLSPSQCLFVGDHPVNDIHGALSAGMSAVFLDAGYLPAPEECVPIIKAPEDLLDRL